MTSLTPVARVVGSPAGMADLRSQLRSELPEWERLAPVLFTNRSQASFVMAGIQFFLDHSQLWWVSAEMCELVYATMPAIPDDLLLSEIRPPSACGLVALEKPWAGMTTLDPESSQPGKPLDIEVVTWGFGLLTAEHRTDIGLTSHVMDLIDHLPYETVGEIPKHIVTQDGERPTGLGVRTEAWHYTEDSEPARLVVPDLPRWYPAGGSTWPLTERVDTSPDMAIRDDRRFLAALWTLIQTKAMGEVVEVGPPRHVRRREEREGRTPSTVKVVYLRRQHRDSPEPTDETKRHFSHRFVVRAHPVMQPYGPGRSLRKLILRGPYLKGPDDAPLVVKEAVRAWVR